MNDRKMCMYVFESGYICGTTASVLADDNKWYCEGHAKSVTPPNKACSGRGFALNAVRLGTIKLYVSSAAFLTSPAANASRWADYLKGNYGKSHRRSARNSKT